MNLFKLFFLIYVIVVGLIYALTRRSGIPKLVPGDIFIAKAGRTIYVPLGASLIITSIIFAILYAYAL